MVIAGGGLEKSLQFNSRGVAINGGGWQNVIVMPIFNIQKVILLPSLSVIINSTRCSYVVTAFEGKFSLSKSSSSNANSGSGLGIPILAQN